MRRLEVHLKQDDSYDTVIRAIKASEPIDYVVLEPEQEDRRLITVFLRDGTGQTLMDTIQTVLEGRTDWRIAVVPIEATAPKIEEAEQDVAKRAKQATREEIYSDIVQDSRLDRDFVVMVLLSTIVAAIGLNSDGIAAVIGAMVIAPLLGPILGFSLGSALGDYSLLKRAGWTLAVGITLALVASLAISFFLPFNPDSRELMSRAEVRVDGLALAMAAGGAAALSMTRGTGAALVGVMVAAALLPPGAAIGLFAGAGEWALASRATLLLLLNVAALILSALIVFRVRRIKPRSWLEQKNADRAVWVNAGLSVFFLAIAIGLILYLDLGARVSLG